MTVTVSCGFLPLEGVLYLRKHGTPCSQAREDATSLDSPPLLLVIWGHSETKYELRPQGRFTAVSCQQNTLKAFRRFIFSTVCRHNLMEEKNIYRREGKFVNNQ